MKRLVLSTLVTLIPKEPMLPVGYAPSSVPLGSLFPYASFSSAPVLPTPAARRPYSEPTVFGQLRVHSTVPEVFRRNTDPFTVLHALQGPMAVEIRCRNPHAKTVVVSTLVHGNEPSSFFAACSLLRNVPQITDFPHHLIVLIQNVRAAKASNMTQRYLHDQGDLNRQWDLDKPSLQDPYIRDVVRYLRHHNLHAVIDIHDTSGVTPPFAIYHGNGTRFAEQSAHLAENFADVIVSAGPVPGTFGRAMSELAPAFSYECGKSHSREAREQATHILQRFITTPTIELSQRKAHAVIGAKVILKNSKVPIKIDAGESAPGTLLLPADIEYRNFVQSPPGTVVARWSGDAMPLSVMAGDLDVTQDYLALQDGKIILVRDAMLCMATLNFDNIAKSEAWFFVS